jgi:hypothetical protein
LREKQRRAKAAARRFALSGQIIPTDFALNEAEAEPFNPACTTACRGCERRYQPLRDNPWCSFRCLDQELRTRYDQQECGCCGTSMAHRAPMKSRIWCSAPCRYRGQRWRKELRARAALTFSVREHNQPADSIVGL